MAFIILSMLHSLTFMLQIPPYKTKVTLRDRSFLCAAPRLWNRLPLEIRKAPSLDNFKSRLKTHLYITHI